MVEQSHNLVVETREEAESIRDVIFAILTSARLTPHAGPPSFGFKSTTRPIDKWTYCFDGPDKKVAATYSFERKDGEYDLLLDLSGLPKRQYEQIIETMKSKAPGFFLQEYGQK